MSNHAKNITAKDGTIDTMTKPQCNEWSNDAIQKLNSDYHRSADTTLLKVSLPHCDNIDFYLKDESAHVTSSLKYRLAYSLFTHGICNGAIKEGTTIVEASSGNTALSEAYFAKLLGLRFITVVPKSTSLKKVKNIEYYGGECVFVESHLISKEAERIAIELNGYFMDQFSNAEKVSDWRDQNNIAASIFRQLEKERFPEPKWLVMSAGTGGTSATMGRYIKWANKDTSLCVPDPEDSIFFQHYKSGDKSLVCPGSRIEGIGRPYYVSSFIPSVIDHMIKVPDAAGIAAMLYFEKVLNKRVGASAGTNIFASLLMVGQMMTQGQVGSVVSVICDSGDLYEDTYWNQEWREGMEFQVERYTRDIAAFYEHGKPISVDGLQRYSR